MRPSASARSRQGIRAVFAMWAGLLCACGESRVEGPRPDRAGGQAGSGGQAAAGRSGPQGNPPPAVALPDAAGATAPDAGPASETCAAEAHEAARLPVDLLFVVDKSGSMALEVDAAGTQWDLVREALMRFVRDPVSAELGAGLNLFPKVPAEILCSSGDDCGGEICFPPRICQGPRQYGLPQACQSDTDCTSPGSTCRPRLRCALTGRSCPAAGQPCSSGLPGDACAEIPRVCRSRGLGQCDGNYQDPVVPVMPLPGGADAFATRLMLTDPSGQTPMGPAIRGGLAHLRERLAANPERRAALVLATDGYPLGCDPTDIDSLAAMVAQARQGLPSISTFVIGVFGAGGAARAQATFDQLATAGGTGQAFIIEPNTDLTTRFLGALAEIRGAVLPCEFQIPEPQAGALDYGKVNVRWKSATAQEEVPYVERADRCDPMLGGWYYDVPPAQGKPARVVVCEASCQRFKNQMAARVELTFGCRTRTIE